MRLLYSDRERTMCLTVYLTVIIFTKNYTDHQDCPTYPSIDYNTIIQFNVSNIKTHHGEIKHNYMTYMQSIKG